MKNTLLVSFAGFAALLGAGCVTRSVIIDSPQSSAVTEPIAVTEFKVRVTAEGEEMSMHATQDEIHDVTPPLVAGVKAYTITPHSSLYTTRREHVLRVTADFKPGESGQNWDEHRFNVAAIDIHEQPFTGPGRVVSPGTTPSTTNGGGATPGPGGPVIRVGTSKNFLLIVPASVTSPTTATLGTPPLPGGGHVTLSDATKSFTPATRTQMVTVTGDVVGPFKIEVTADGFLPSSVTGNVVP